MSEMIEPGTLVVYDYPAAAISCSFNGARIRGTGVVTGYDDGWPVIDGRLRVRTSEITMRGQHRFKPDASGYGCRVCRFNRTTSIHSERSGA